MPEISEEIKSFYDKVFAAEGNLFETFSFSFALVKKAMLEELSSAVHKPGVYTVLNIPHKVIYEVEDAGGIAEKLEIEVYWIDRILVKIDKKLGILK